MTPLLFICIHYPRPCFTYTPLVISQPEERARTAIKRHQECPKQCRSSFGSLVGWPVEFSALLLSLLVIVVIAEVDAGSLNSNGFSHHMKANSADSSVEQFSYCSLLEKVEAFECFRDMAAMQMKDNAILHTALESETTKTNALVSENTAMASTIAMLQSSVEIGGTEQHALLEPSETLDQPSDGTCL